MDKNILIVALFVVILIVVSVYITQNQILGGTDQKQGTSTTYYVINYGADNETGVAEQLSDGSYRLKNGTVIPANEQVSVVERFQGQSGLYCCPSNCPLTYDPVCGSDGNTYVNVCGASLAGMKIAYGGVCGQREVCDMPCIEPKPNLRFICQNGEIVKNRIDCEGNESCPYAVKKYWVCANGSRVDDPNLCPAPAGAATTAMNIGIKTIYVCSDGREVTSEADCSANCAPATTTVTHVSSNYGSGGVVGVVYECWDGSITKNANECPSFCKTECTCGQEENPVCAKGKTYLNPCLARCANITTYTQGPCEQPECAKTNDRCTPAGTVGATLTHLTQYQFPTCCEPGSYCSANGVCVPSPTCVGVGQSCVRPNVTYTTAYVPNMQSNCCQGLYCDESSTCTNRSACVSSGNSCGTVKVTTGNTVITNYFGSCCQGYICTDNKCVIGQCIQEYGNCRQNADCCQGMTCSQSGQCRKPCVKEGEKCSSSLDCCGEASCMNGVCRIGTEEPQELCSGAVNGPEWTNSNSCATGYFDGEWGTWCGYCGDDNTREYRYYCVRNTTYTFAGAPSSVLTDQVALSSMACPKLCSGTMCQ